MVPCELWKFLPRATKQQPPALVENFHVYALHAQTLFFFSHLFFSSSSLLLYPTFSFFGHSLQLCKEAWDPGGRELFGRIQGGRREARRFPPRPILSRGSQQDHQHQDNFSSLATKSTQPAQIFRGCWFALHAYT